MAHGCPPRRPQRHRPGGRTSCRCAARRRRIIARCTLPRWTSRPQRAAARERRHAARWPTAATAATADTASRRKRAVSCQAVWCSPHLGRQSVVDRQSGVPAASIFIAALAGGAAFPGYFRCGTLARADEVRSGPQPRAAAGDGPWRLGPRAACHVRACANRPPVLLRVPSALSAAPGQASGRDGQPRPLSCPEAGTFSPGTQLPQQARAQQPGPRPGIAESHRSSPHL